MSEQSQDVPPVRLTPELLEWARKQLNEEEIVAGLRRRKGGRLGFFDNRGSGGIVGGKV